MHFPQLLVYETDGRLARLLEGTAGTHRWVLRQPRRWESCLCLLRRGGPAVVVIRMESDLERAFGLLEVVAWHFPQATAVVIGDTPDAVLADLAWDLGAGFVLFPPQSREELVDVVAGLMDAVSHRHEPA
jgi:hypothetical protein